MRILFLLSSLEPAGSETYCLSLARAWQGRHEIFWISDRLHYGQAYESLPISQKAFPDGVVNTFKVAAFIRRNRIDLVHSHSRRAHWIAAQAAALTKIPHVTTIHQPPPVHLFSRLFPCLGDQAIAIDEAVVDHLAKYFRRSGSTVSLIRNGIELPPPPLSATTSLADPPSRNGGDVKKILLLGRLTGGRWEVVCFFLDVLKRIGRTLPAARYQIAGRIPEERADVLPALLREANRMIAPSTVETIGWTHHLSELIQDSDGVIGGGRSALESLAAGKPVILLGEGGIIGRCGPDTWPEALRTNQGDHLTPKEFVPAQLELALRDLLNEKTPTGSMAQWGREQVEKYYDIRAVARDVEKVYECLISPS